MGLSFSQQGATPGGSTFSFMTHKPKPAAQPGNTNATGSFAGAGQGVNLTGLLPSGGSNNGQQSSGSPIPGVTFAPEANPAYKPPATPGMFGASTPKVNTGLISNQTEHSQYVTPPTPVQAPTTGTTNNGSSSTGTTGGTVSTPSGGIGMGMMGGGQTQPIAPQQPQPGTPGFFAQQAQNIIGNAGNLIASPLQQAGVGTIPQRISDAELARGNFALGGTNKLLEASMPQSFPYTSNVINPLTGQSYGAGGAGQGGAFYGGQQAGEISAGQNSATMTRALGAAQAVGNNLTKLISDANINPGDPQFINSLNQFLQTGVASNPQYQQFYGAVNDYVSSLAPILGAGGSETNQKLDMAGQMVSQLASGKSIQQTIQYFDQLAQQKIQGFNQGGSFGGSTGGSSSGGTGFAEQW